MDIATIIALVGTILGLFYFIFQWLWDRHKWTEEKKNISKKLKDKEREYEELKRIVQFSIDYKYDAKNKIQKREKELLHKNQIAENNLDQNRFIKIMVEQNKELNIKGLKTKTPIFMDIRDIYVPIYAKGNFSDYKLYPRVFYKPVNQWNANECKYLIELISNYPSLLRDQKTEKIINEAVSGGYLPKNEIEKIKANIKHRYAREKTIDEPLTIKLLFHIYARGYFKDTMLSIGKRIIIIGDPGSGKSTLLQFISLVFATNKQLEVFDISDKLLPFIVRLRDLPSRNFTNSSLANLLYSVSQDSGYNLSSDFYQSNLESGNFLILFDGLDEVSDESERDYVVDWIQRATVVYPNNSYILTSRPSGYRSHTLKSFAKIQLDKFNNDQIDKFCQFWIKAVETGLRGETEDVLKKVIELASDLIDAIHSKPQIEKLAENPLMLSIIALVHRYRARLPDRRVDLYSECLDVFLEHWDAAKRLSIPFPAHKARQILQPLALQYHLEGVKEMSKEKIANIVKTSFPRININNNLEHISLEFLSIIRDRSGILTGYSMTTYGFAHLTFQEYLTAVEIADTSKEKMLIEKFGQHFWDEVFLLYVGLKDCSNFLETLMHTIDIVENNIQLAILILAESLSCNPEVKEEFIKKIVKGFLQLNDPQIINELLDFILDNYKNQNIITELLSICFKNNPQCTFSKEAVWKFYRNAKIKKISTKAYNEIDRLIDFEEAVKKNESAIKKMYSVLSSQLVA